MYYICILALKYIYVYLRLLIVLSDKKNDFSIRLGLSRAKLLKRLTTFQGHFLFFFTIFFWNRIKNRVELK